MGGFELDGELEILFAEQDVPREEDESSDYDSGLDSDREEGDHTFRVLVCLGLEDGNQLKEAGASPDLVEGMKRLNVRDCVGEDDNSCFVGTVPVPPRGHGSTNETAQMTSTASASSSADRQHQSGHKRQRQNDGNHRSSGEDGNDDSQERRDEPRAASGDAHREQYLSCFAKDCMFRTKPPSWLL